MVLLKFGNSDTLSFVFESKPAIPDAWSFELIKESIWLCELVPILFKFVWSIVCQDAPVEPVAIKACLL